LNLGRIKNVFNKNTAVKLYFKIIFLLFPIIIFNCKKDAAVPATNPIEIEEDFFKAFSCSMPDNDLTIDTINNRIYVSELGFEGKIYCYDYENYELISQTIVPDYYGHDYGFTFGFYNGSPELFVGSTQVIWILDGETLVVKDSIKVYDDSDDRKIGSLAFHAPNLIFLGGCNSGFPGDRVKVYNRTTKEKISEGDQPAGCLRIRSYQNSTQDSIGIIGLKYQTSTEKITLDIFNKEGVLLESKVNYSPQADLTASLLKTNDVAPYFISSDEGNIFLKENLEFSNTLGGAFVDILITQSGDRIVGVTRDALLQTYEYPSLDLVNELPLEKVASRLFFDNQKLILVYFVFGSSGEEDSIYISKLDF
jgi:hypothetical protein